MLEALVRSPNGARMTHLMYLTEVNPTVIKRFLVAFVECGLVEEREKRFFITDEGRKAYGLFFDAYCMLNGKQLPKGLPLFLKVVPNVV